MGDKDEFIVPPGQRQLFIDDHGVAQMEGVTRVLHQPSKKGTVIRPDFAKGERGVQTRSTPYWDSQAERFRLLADSVWYESVDGLHWGRSEQQFESGDDTPAYCVLYDETDPDSKRLYKGFTMHTIDPATGRVVRDDSEMVDPEGKPWPGKKFQMLLDFVVSPNGYDWRRLDCSFPSSDEQNLSYDPLGNQFIVSFKRGGTYGRSHAITTSPDFESWTEPVLSIQTDDLDQELGRLHIEELLQTPNADYLRPFPNTAAWHWQNVDIYNAGVFRYEGIFLALPAIYHARGERWTSHALRFTLIQLWHSRDLCRWERAANRQTFLRWSPLGSGAYDLTKNMPPSYPLVRGDELWFYYTGGKEYSDYQNPASDHFAVCLAVLRRDGFISLNAGDEQGSVTTEPFVLPEGGLWVNADARRGQVVVELLDSEGNVTAASADLEGDHRRVQVQWDEGNLSAAAGPPVQLRFKLRNASLYSYWIE